MGKWMLTLSSCLYLLGCGEQSSHSFLSQAGTSPDAFRFADDFLFGIATAPGHAEDQLDDTWLDFAKKGRVTAWKNQGHPELRLKFWTAYATEIDHAKELGVQVFRLGVDWGRLVPRQPENLCPGEDKPCYEGVLDQEALAHYQEMIRYIRAQGMVPMVTLFHHSLPVWLDALNKKQKGGQDLGGWTHKASKDYFAAFAKDVVKALAADVDLWVIFNEANVFSSLAYAAGIWPPGNGLDPSGFVKFAGFKGRSFQAMDQMIEAHKEVYALIKSEDQSSSGDPRVSQYGPSFVGIAHNIAYFTADNFATKPLTDYINSYMNEYFLDAVMPYLDFLGLNYYGEESVGALGPHLRSDREYSESGRGVSPQGFYLTLKRIAKRYLSEHPMPIFITENGVSDSSDKLRPAYLVEHLKALHAALGEGLPIMGYVFWTLSDNWEWSDGYCPKFGLLEVDRSSQALVRIPRASFRLYQDIITKQGLSEARRQEIWDTFRAEQGKARPFCRSKDGISSLDEPVSRNFVRLDWQFKAP